MPLKKEKKKILVYVILTIFVFFTLAPICWLAITSLSTVADLNSVPPKWIPEHIITWRYLAILFGVEIEQSAGGEIWGGEMTPQAALYFRQTLVNSFVISATTALICVAIGSAAAYVCSRVDFLLRSPLTYFMVGNSMIPVIVLALPLTSLINQLGLIDTYLGVIVAYTGRFLPFATWLMIGFFNSLPKELDEAAMADGCSRLGAYLRIILPISGPGLVAMGIWSFITSWNEFLLALVLTNTYRAKTLAVSVGEYSVEQYTNFGMMSTAGVIAIIVPVVTALIFQRYIVKGLTAGAVKG